MRDDALKQIETLDCGNPDKALASCDSAAAPPPEVLVWKKELAAAGLKTRLMEKLSRRSCGASSAKATTTLFIFTWSNERK